MSLTKAQLVFDSTTPANGDAVASYLFASNRLTSAAVAGNESLRTIAALQDGAGTALTSTLTGGKQALDINIAGFSASSGFDVQGNVADGSSDTGTNPVKIGSRLFSGALGAGSAGNRADTLADLYRRMYVTSAPQVGNKLTSTTVGTAAVKIVATPMAGVQTVRLMNNGSQPIYIGVDNTVTADNTATGGLLLPAHGGFMELGSGDAIVWWAISGTAGQRLLVVEVG